MKRELTIERRGENYHLRFHNYMGPWEGHQIEKILELEEVAPPPGGEEYERVLDLNEAYLWHEMDFDSDLHALITPDRLETLAQLVRDRDVTVLAGEEFLPDAPPSHIVYDATDDTPEGSYIAHIEMQHQSVWQRGPKAVIGAILLRGIPALVVVFAIVVISRHTGDSYEQVDLAEVFARAEHPAPEQGFWQGLINPQDSHRVRNEIRSVSFAGADRMIVDGRYYVAFEGAGEVMPWVNRMSMQRSPLEFDATLADGKVHVESVTCGESRLGGGYVLVPLAILPPGDSSPMRGTSGGPARFQTISTLEAGPDETQALSSLIDQRVSIEGQLRYEDGRTVLRQPNGTGIVVRPVSATGKMAAFFDTFTDEPVAVTADLVVREVFPWEGGEAVLDQREGTEVLGRAIVYSVSAQNYHAVGKR